MSLKKIFCTCIAAYLGVAFALPLFAQGLFDPVATVNNRVVTEFEVQQRQAFLTVLNSPETSRDVVIEELIDERLRAEEVQNAGLELSPEAVEAGLSEFAGRAEMEYEEFIAALEDAGIAEETVVDFVSNGVAWREYIGSRFGPRLEISEAEIDSALGNPAASTAIRVLVSEIIIPAPADQLDQVRALADEIAQTTSQDEFSNYARQYSAAPTRDAGGRVPWQPIGNLPPVLRPILLSLAPGEVTDPLTIPNAIALFQLRDIEETGAPAPQYAAIDYAIYYIAGGRTPQALAEAEKIRAQVDVCNDLYGIAQGQPPEVLERVILPPSEIPNDIAIELARMDRGEVSTTLTRSNGQTLVFLMMCGRTEAANEDADRAEVAAALRSSRLNALAESLMAQLRADARIIYQ